MNETLREALLRIDSEESKALAALRQAVTGEDRVAVYRVLDGLSEAIRDGAALASEPAPASGEGPTPPRHIFRHVDPEAPCPTCGFPAWTHDPATAYLWSQRLAQTATPPEPGLDVERLYQAILDELVVLWGEPSDAVSVQVRPILARQIADRYALSASPIPEAD